MSSLSIDVGIAGYIETNVSLVIKVLEHSFEGNILALQEVKDGKYMVILKGNPEKLTKKMHKFIDNCPFAISIQSGEIAVVTTPTDIMPSKSDATAGKHILLAYNLQTKCKLEVFKSIEDATSAYTQHLVTSTLPS